VGEEVDVNQGKRTLFECVHHSRGEIFLSLCKTLPKDIELGDAFLLFDGVMGVVYDSVGYHVGGSSDGELRTGVPAVN